MDGLLIIDKPEGFTSHDVVARVRRILGTRRVGHTGTLDPFATGVLVLLIGNATRLARFVDKDEKEYDALVRFGFETDTGDRAGKPSVPTYNCEHLSVAKISDALDLFRGEIEQVPPMYSAKKVKGTKLYQSARKGEIVERKPTRVRINELEITSDLRFNDKEARTCDLRLRIVCSAGTYIRTLAEDIGRRVGSGAHLAELRRTRAGRFGTSSAVSLLELGASADPGSYLLPLEAAVENLPSIVVSDDRVAATSNGLSTCLKDICFDDGEMVRLLDADGRLLAIGSYTSDVRSVQPRIVLI
jgi:tRNA pseudouridine55 synthase